MTRSSLNSSTSTLDHSPDVKSAFSSDPTITNHNSDSSPSTTKLNSICQNRYLKIFNSTASSSTSNGDGSMLSKRIKKFQLGSIVGQQWKRLKNKHSINFSHSNETFVTPPSSPSDTTNKETLLSPKTSGLNEQLYSLPETSDNSRITSPRISYESGYTTIDYSELVRNSAGSDLSFRCRGLISTSDEDGWNSEICNKCDQLELEGNNECFYCQIPVEGLERIEIEEGGSLH